MKKAKFKMTGNGSGTEEVSESSCLCASVLKKDAGVIEGGFNTETQRRGGTEFKMTEIGLIPENWEVKRIGNIGQVVTGSTPPRNNSANWSGDFNWISAKDFNGKYISKTEEHITEAGKRFCRLLPENSVLVTCIASIGLNAISKKACATNQQINAVVCRVDSPEYLYYQICYRNGDLKLLAGQTAVPIIGKKQFEDVLISLPPLHEQKKIAEALSDVDELLAAMTTLIEKKRAIKQGAMQELLGIRNEVRGIGMRNCVPRRRLPGFSGEWIEKRLGDVCSITTGHKDVNEGCENGLYPFFTCSRNALTSNQYSFDTEAILVAGNGDVGNLHYYCGKFEAYQRTYVLSDFMIYARYLWYELQFNLMNRLNDGKIGSTIPYIVLGQLLNYNFRIPPTVAEQKAIVEVLSDMDAEIAALEAKRAKYESIKQGMMQELLTGKTRLKGA